MSTFNTIILLHGSASLTNQEYKEFTCGDTIWGNDAEPEELKRWSIDQKEEAQKELAKYRCKHAKSICSYDIEEYALEYCECDEDGEFVQGSGFDLAEEE